MLFISVIVVEFIRYARQIRFAPLCHHDPAMIGWNAL